MTLTRFVQDSPIGPLTIVMRDGTVIHVAFPGGEDRLAGRTRQYFKVQGITDGPPHAATRAAFEAYFSGRTDALDNLDVDPQGTDFEGQVWRALRTIPAGETRSYAAMAAHVGKPKAMRAVGRANGLNPIPLILPCHRVIGADGSLTGFGGGLERKAWLLRHEGALVA